MVLPFWREVLKSVSYELGHGPGSVHDPCIWDNCKRFFELSESSLRIRNTGWWTRCCINEEFLDDLDDDDDDEELKLWQ